MTLPKLIAITGRKGHGKDTAAKILISKEHYINLKFADPLKHMTRMLLSITKFKSDLIDRIVDGDLKERKLSTIMQEDDNPLASILDLSLLASNMIQYLMHYQSVELDNDNYFEPQECLQFKTPEFAILSLTTFIHRWKQNHSMTTRNIMQELGTEFGRQVLGDRLWIDAALLKIKIATHPMVVTDMRFPNERDALYEKGATLIRIKRPYLTGGNFDHPSEASIDDLVVDHEIINNGTIEELHDRVMESLTMKL